MPTLWMIGCGNMGGAMLRRWIGSGTLAADDVTVVRPSAHSPLPGIRALAAPPAEPGPDILVLSVKPQMLDLVAPAWANVRPAILVSILAGVDEGALARRFAAGTVVRAMPNLPVAIGKGVVALHSHDAGGPARAVVDALMSPLGLVEWIDDASLFDLVTALSGSGPGFVYRFIDALAQGGAALGLPAAQAQRLALATVEGAGLLAAAADVPPAALADRVASRGGSTRQGLDVLDRDDALNRLVHDTLVAAVRRNAEMAAEAKDQAADRSSSSR